HVPALDPLHILCAQSHWSVEPLPSGCDPQLATAHAEQKEQPAILAAQSVPLPAQSESSPWYVPHQRSCNSPAAGLRGHASRQHPGCRRPSANAASESSSSSPQFCFAAPDSKGDCQVVLHPPSWSTCCSAHLPCSSAH